MIKNGVKVKVLNSDTSSLEVNDMGIVYDLCDDNTFRVQVDGRPSYANWFTEEDVEVLTENND